MFESITIKAKEVGDLPVDPGFVAECLLFYGTVNLLADRVTLPAILDVFGVEGIKQLIVRGRLRLFIREDVLAVMEFPQKQGATFDIHTTSGARIEQGNTLAECIFRLQGNTVNSRKDVDELLALSKPYKYSDQVLEDINESLRNLDFLSKCVAETINFWNPESRVDFRNIVSRYEQSGSFGPFKSHQLQLNINTSSYRNVTHSGILLNVAEAIGDIHIASGFASEIADNLIYTSIVRHKVETLANKSVDSQGSIVSFQDTYLSRHRNIAEAIRNKSVPFSEFLALLEKADKFRDWLSGLDVDAKILAEYHEAVVAETWADKLPTKGVRFFLFTGAGLLLDATVGGGLGTSLGIALGLGDNFLLDKLVKGWKPSQFVDEHLKPVLPLLTD